MRIIIIIRGDSAITKTIIIIILCNNRIASKKFGTSNFSAPSALISSNLQSE